MWDEFKTTIFICFKIDINMFILYFGSKKSYI